MLNEFSDDEIETVLAHELAHHVHKDIPLGMLVSTVITLGGLYLAHLGNQNLADADPKRRSLSPPWMEWLL